MTDVNERRPLPDTFGVPVLPSRYVVVVEAGGPGPALEWALDHAPDRSVPVVLAGPPDQFVLSRSFLQSIADQLHGARNSHALPDVSAAPGGNADLRPSDLLVMGTHHDIDHGTRTQAARIAGLAPCSSMIVPANAPAGAGVLAAINSLDGGRPTARFGAAEAELRGEPLTLLHVRDASDAAADHGEDPLPALAELVRVEYPRVDVRTETADGPVVPRILEAAVPCSILVVGAQPATSAHSTLSLIARSTRIPVVVAKPGVPLDDAE